MIAEQIQHRNQITSSKNPVESSREFKFIKTASQYSFAFILSLFIFAVVSHLWLVKLHIPFNYEGDAVIMSSWIKSVMDNGWYLTNPYLGAPNGYVMADFPMSESFHFLIIKLLSYLTANYAVVLNVFYILTFPTSTLTALFVLRRLNLTYPLALTASILFSMLPFHFLRQEGHLFLSSYYSIPLYLWLVLWVTNPPKKENFVAKQMLQCTLLILLCMILASSGVYYAFFGTFYIFLSGLITSVTKRKWYPLRRATFIISMLILTVLINLMPTFINNQVNGINKTPITRYPFQAEYFAIKMTALLLPIYHDRIPAFADLRLKYETPPLDMNGGVPGAFGIIASSGFLILLGSFLFRKESENNRGEKEKSAESFSLISKLNLCGILFATVGGFGAFFAYTVTPLIRCYDRMAIFLGFFSLYAFFYCAQKVITQATSAYRYFTLCLFSLIVLILGTFNQTSSSYSLDQEFTFIKNNLHNDKAFAQLVEKSLPVESIVFQLPYFPYPEADYDHLKPYLFTHHIKWSFGAMSGRPVDHWQEKISKLEPREMINQLKKAGFAGIYIDRKKYKDHAIILETRIINILGYLPFVSENSNLSFFPLDLALIKIKPIVVNPALVLLNSHSKLTPIHSGKGQT